MGGRVIVGPFLSPGKETTVVEKDGYCRHARYEVDETERSVCCGTCGAVLDAFDVLLSYAEKERVFHRWEAQGHEAAKRVQALKDEEKLIKARTRSHHRKDAEAAVAEEREKWKRKLDKVKWKARQVADLARQIAEAAGEARETKDPRPEPEMRTWTP